MLTYYGSILYLGIFAILYFLGRDFNWKKIVNGAIALCLLSLMCWDWYGYNFLNFLADKCSSWNIFDKSHPFIQLEYLRTNLGSFVVANYTNVIKDLVDQLKYEYMFYIYFYLFVAAIPLACFYVFKKHKHQDKLLKVMVFSVISLLAAIIANPYNLPYRNWIAFLPPTVVIGVSSFVVFYQSTKRVRLAPTPMAT